MRRATALLIAGALAGSACVSQGDPSFTIQALSTDIAFGVEVKEPAGPVTPEVAAPLPDSVGQGGFEPPQLLPPRSFDSPLRPPLPPITQTTPEECPTAPPTAAADEPATENVTRLPTEGVYRWKREGVQTILIPETGDTVEVPIGGFEKRIVQNVEEESDTIYTYEVVAPLLDRPAVSITTYRVDTDSEQFQPGGAVVIDEPRVNDPEGGVAISRVVIQEADGTEASFDPTTALLLLGLPAIPSEQFTASSADPRSGESIVQEGQVKGRDRIDACGDLIDGWRVDASQTRSDSAGTVTFNYIVANQIGGLVIEEFISKTNEDGSSIEILYTLGQKDPDPLPEGSGDQ